MVHLDHADKELYPLFQLEFIKLKRFLMRHFTLIIISVFNVECDWSNNRRSIEQFNEES